MLKSQTPPYKIHSPGQSGDRDLNTPIICVSLYHSISALLGAAGGSLALVYQPRCTGSESCPLESSVVLPWWKREIQECLNLGECLGKHTGANWSCGSFHTQHSPASDWRCVCAHFTLSYRQSLKQYSIFICMFAMLFCVSDVFICYNSKISHLKGCTFSIMWRVWCLVATGLPVITLLNFCMSFEVWRWVGWDNTVTIVRSCLHLNLSWKKQLCLMINLTLLPTSKNVKFIRRSCLPLCQAAQRLNFWPEFYF
jgi:hypothetical protein